MIAMATRPRRLPGQVVFDVGNVLLAWDTRRLLADHLPAGLDADLFRRSIFEHPDWVELDRGALDEEEAVARFVERTGAGVELVRRLVHESKAQLTPMPESLALLEELHGERVRLFCLTNMSHGTWEYLRPRHGFWARFERIVVSAQIGLVKPDAAIYRHLLATTGIDAATTAFFDDRPDNVAAARDAGIRAHRFEDAASARGWLYQGLWSE